jgi:hypothetical protein
MDNLVYIDESLIILFRNTIHDIVPSISKGIDEMENFYVESANLFPT